MEIKSVVHGRPFLVVGMVPTVCDVCIACVKIKE